MKSITLGSNLYFEAYLACPVCYERGKNSGADYWQHADNGCGGKLYLGDDAQYYCEKCKRRSHVGKWKYGCPGHSNSSSDELEYHFASNAALASVISCAGQLVNAAGVPWLQEFLHNLGS
ncbi:MAG: hypothetical protein LBL07_00610 [Tannerella sp.]|jgi:hypothetical protein|nr:hypothetical protein [Tannerella sp.]